jgi:hypothetical protein
MATLPSQREMNRLRRVRVRTRHVSEKPGSRMILAKVSTSLKSERD